MAGILSSVSTFLFGDGTAEGLQGRVSTYEELHAEVQGILIPATLPRGVSVRLLQPLNKNFALTHRCEPWALAGVGRDPLRARV